MKSAEGPTLATPAHRHPPRPDWYGAARTRCICEQRPIRRLIERRSRWAPSAGRMVIAGPRCSHRHGVTRGTRGNGCVGWFRMIDAIRNLCNVCTESRHLGGRVCRDISTVNPCRAGAFILKRNDTIIKASPIGLRSLACVDGKDFRQWVTYKQIVPDESHPRK